LARIIDQDKKGRLQLSSRESVLSEATYRLMKPAGTTGNFMKDDKKRQDNANMRNKVLKFGPALSLK